MDFNFKENYDIHDLLNIMKLLRSPDGCPWDIKQSHKSIRGDLLEEAYEVADAIDNNDVSALCEELGDLLLQVAFHSQIAVENDEFSFDDVADGICKKLILRHPHVFGDVTVNSADDVLKNWDAIKMVEKNQPDITETLKSVPAAFPSLMRAAKVQKRASKAGFDWAEIEGALNKVFEESDELKVAIENNDQENIDEEIGDLLFSVVNVSRFASIDCEKSLNKSTNKFIDRFSRLEKNVTKQGKNINQLSLSELDKIWKEIK